MCIASDIHNSLSKELSFMMDEDSRELTAASSVNPNEKLRKSWHYVDQSSEKKLPGSNTARFSSKDPFIHHYGSGKLRNNTATPHRNHSPKTFARNHLHTKKDSVDSNDTNTMIRQSPTGIRMSRRNKDKSSKYAFHTTPQTTHTVTHTTQIVPHTTYTVPQVTHSVPWVTHSVPWVTHSVPHTTRTVPQTTHTVPQTTRTVPQTTHTVPQTAHSLLQKTTNSPHSYHTSSASARLQMIIDTAADSKKERKNTQYLKKRLGKRDLSHKVSTHGTYNPLSLRSSQFIGEYGEQHSFSNKTKPNSLSTNTLFEKIDRTNLDSPASKINPQFKIHNLKSGLRMRTKSVPALKVNRRFSVDASRSNLSEENIERDKRTVEEIDKNNERRYLIDERISNEKKYFEERTHSFKNKREQQDITSSNDDWRSLNTDVLVDSPRMPLFNASPSLTTESLVSETNSTKSYDTLIENLALKTSFLASDNASQGSGYLKLAVTSHRKDKNDSVEPLFSGYNETR